MKGTKSHPILLTAILVVLFAVGLSGQSALDFLDRAIADLNQLVSVVGAGRQVAQVISGSTAAAINLFDGEAPFTYEYGSATNDCYAGNSCFRAEPDNWHLGTLKLNGLASYGEDISSYDEIWLFAKAGQAGQDFSLSFYNWPNFSSGISLGDHSERGVLDTDWQLVRLPVADFSNANFDGTSIQHILFSYAPQGNTVTVDSIIAVELTGVDVNSLPLLGPLPPVNFSETSVGGRAEQTFVVKNVGSASLTISSLEVTGDNAADFDITNNSFALAPGESQTVSVTFAPTSPGAKSAAVTINHTANPFGTSAELALNGTAVGPKISVASSLNLGSVPVGQGIYRTLTVSNTGNQNLNVSSITSSNDTFTISPSFINNLAPNASADLSVTFTPVDASSVTGVLTLSSDDPITPTSTVNLTARGTTGGELGGLSLAVSTTTSNRVDLSWSSYVGSDQIKIYLGPEPPAVAGAALPVSKLVATLPAGTQAYSLTGLSADTDIFIRVEALANGVVIAASNLHAKTLGGPLVKLATPLREVHLAAPNILELVLLDEQVTSYIDATDPNNYSRIEGYDGGTWQAGPWTITRNDGSTISVTNIYRHSVPSGNPAYSKAYSPIIQWYPDNYIVNVDHHVYLVLAEPIGNRDILSISGPLNFNITLPFSDKYLVTSAIQLNQVGYSPKATRRYAYVSKWLGDGGPLSLSNFPTTADVLIDPVDALTPRTSVVEDISLTERSAFDSDAGAAVKEINLSQVPAAEGTVYRVYLPGVGVSWPTQVSHSAVFKAFYVTARGIFYNRWGRDLKPQWADQWSTRAPDHPIVYLADLVGQLFAAFFPENTPTNDTLALSGGHHNAGDFDQQWAQIWWTRYILKSYEANPSVFVDNQLNIPESGNGIPDMLDLALYDLKGWGQLQDVDGGIRAGVESTRHPGFYFADSDPLVYWTYAKDPTFSMYAAGAFAEAAYLVAPFDQAKSTELRDQALRAYNWAIAQGVNEGWTAYLYAVGELGRLTGEETYARAGETALQLADQWGNNSSAIMDRNDGWFQLGNFVIGSTTTPPATRSPNDFGAWLMIPGVKDWFYGSTSINHIKTLVDTFANQIDNEHAFRNGRPSGWGIGWGAGAFAGSYTLVINNWLSLARNGVVSLSAADEEKYLNAISLSMDFTLGGNPEGRLWITGLGSRYLTDPLFSDAIAFTQSGKALMPGITGFGPVNDLPAAEYYDPTENTFYPSFMNQPLFHRFADARSFVDNTEGDFGLNAITIQALGTLLTDGLQPSTAIQPLGSEHLDTLAPRYSLISGGSDKNPPASTISPTPGNYESAQSILFSCVDGEGSGCSVYYCLTADCTPNTLYSSAITVSATTTIRYRATDTAGNTESIKTATYNISAPTDSVPPITTITPAGGSYDSTQSVGLTRSETGTTYYCLGDGCTPNLTYVGSVITVSSSTTIRYYSVDTAGNVEETKTATYTITTIANDSDNGSSTTTPATNVVSEADDNNSGGGGGGGGGGSSSKQSTTTLSKADIQAKIIELQKILLRLLQLLLLRLLEQARSAFDYTVQIAGLGSLFSR